MSSVVQLRVKEMYRTQDHISVGFEKYVFGGDLWMQKPLFNVQCLVVCKKGDNLWDTDFLIALALI